MRLAAGGKSLTMRGAGGRFAAERLRQLSLFLAQARRLATIWLRDPGQALCEDLAVTTMVFAEELAHMDMHVHWPPAPGQIGQRAFVAAVYRCGRLGADGACCRRLQR